MLEAAAKDPTSQPWCPTVPVRGSALGLDGRVWLVGAGPRLAFAISTAGCSTPMHRSVATSNRAMAAKTVFMDLKSFLNLNQYS